MLSVGKLVQKAWFHLYDIQEKAKLWGQINSLLVSKNLGSGERFTTKRDEGPFSSNKMVYMLIAVVLQLCIFVKNCYRTVHSKRGFLLYINYASIKLNWIDLWGEKKAKPKTITSLLFIILCKLFEFSWSHLLICITDNTYIAEFLIYVMWLPMVKSYSWVLVCVWLGSSVNIMHSLIRPRCWPPEFPFIARVIITALRFRM